MTTYAVSHSDGRTERGLESYEDALSTCRIEYGTDIEYGHDGDLTDGGDRTLVWACEDDSVDDDGARAVASIWREGR